MGERTAADGDVAGIDGIAAFGQARALIDAAEAQAREIVAEAARRARSREQEADLLVAKARRVLVAAEQKADVILTAARSAAEVLTIDLTDEAAESVRRFTNASGARLARPLPTRIDRMLASAIANAVDEALPADASR